MFSTIKGLGAVSIVVLSTSAAYAASFNSAVETVLKEQKEIKELDSGRQGEMIACVQTTLTEVPPPRQSYVAEAANFDEMENRFGEVVLENQAEFKQLITKNCGGIALEK